EQARLARDALDQALESQGTRQAASLKDLSATLSQQLEALVRAYDQRMAEVRLAVDGEANFRHALVVGAHQRLELLRQRRREVLERRRLARALAFERLVERVAGEPRLF